MAYKVENLGNGVETKSEPSEETKENNGTFIERALIDDVGYTYPNTKDWLDGLRSRDIHIPKIVSVTTFNKLADAVQGNPLIANTYQSDINRLMDFIEDENNHTPQFIKDLVKKYVDPITRKKRLVRLTRYKSSTSDPVINFLRIDQSLIDWYTLDKDMSDEWFNDITRLRYTGKIRELLNNYKDLSSEEVNFLLTKNMLPKVIRVMLYKLYYNNVCTFMKKYNKRILETRKYHAMPHYVHRGLGTIAGIAGGAMMGRGSDELRDRKGTNSGNWLKRNRGTLIGGRWASI